MAKRDEWLCDVISGLVAYYLTSLPVLVGVLFGIDFLAVRATEKAQPRPNLVTACTRFDGQHYLDIIRNGYFFDPERRSTVAFFPVYPLLSWCLSKISGLHPDWAALFVAHLALATAFILLARYARVRWPEATGEQRALVLAAFGLWPATLFLRMSYAESLFVCGMLALLYGMAQHWPLLALALVAGLVTGIRPPGVAVVPAFAWHVLTQGRTTLVARASSLVVLIPVACWGLLAYMLYQQWVFENPLAFAQTQEHWRSLAQPDDWDLKIRSLLRLEPIWGQYLPAHYYQYWGNIDKHGNPAFSLMFWNPILFVAAAFLLLYGARKRWLTASEVLLGVGLLGIPYVTRGYEMSMGSQARFAAVVVVNYLVIGRFLAQRSPLVANAACVLASMLLCTWSALFAAGGYLIF
jgi:hypothetical protein